MQLKVPFALVLAGMGLAVASCTTDEITVPKSELYTREFIKQFGVFDPNHDWNHSQRVNVTVTTSTPTDIKIYASVNGTRYLFGTFLGVNGSRDLGVDIPKGVTHVIVNGGGQSIKVQSGAKINLSGAKSRVIADNNDSYVKSKSLHSEEDKWMVIPWLNGTIFRRKMPEDFYNADREGVSPDFMFRNNESTPISFIVRPLYWQTSRRHKLGIFYYDESGEKVHVPIWEMSKVSEYSEDLLYAIAKTDVKYVRVPVSEFEKYMTKYGVVRSKLGAEDNFDSKCTSADDRDMTKACREYLEDVLPPLEGRTDGKKFNYVYRWKFLTNEDVEGGEGDLLIVYTYFNYKITKGPGGSNNPWGQWPTPEGGVPDNPIPSDNPDENDYNAIVSKGIEVTIAPGLLYGFYIEDATDESKRYYSTRSENKAAGWYPVGERDENDHYTQFEQRGQASYAATWIGTKYNWRYLAFEDWDSNGSTFTSEMKDLNDLVFILEETDVAPTIIDIEHGDKVSMPYEWVVACEDLGATDDFDFNDVVFGVSNYQEDAEGNATVDVRALAAGGTLEIYLMHEKVDGPIGNKEFHQWFKSSSLNPVNVGGKATTKGETFQVPVEKGFTMTCCHVIGEDETNMGGFYVRVKKSGSDAKDYDIKAPNLTKNAQNEAPQMICVPMDWKWPTERTHIVSVYDLFDDWVVNEESCPNWHANPKEGGYTVRTDLPNPLPSPGDWGNQGGNQGGEDEKEASVEGPEKVNIGWDINKYKIKIPKTWLKVNSTMDFMGTTRNENITIFNQELSSWENEFLIHTVPANVSTWTLTSEDIEKLSNCIDGDYYVIYAYMNNPEITKIIVRT